MKPKNGAKMENDTDFQILPLKSILVDHAFNARHADHLKTQSQEVAGGGEIQSDGVAGGTVGLMQSIESEGQDTPVLVRVNHDEKTAKTFPYRLVSGFGRYSALEMIAAKAIDGKVAHPIAVDPEWSPKNPTIKAQVKEMTDSEAYMANMRENTARNNLSGADLAFGVHRLMEEYKHEKGGNARGGKREIARALGKDESYIGLLVNIMTGLPPAITADWRTSKAPVAVTKLEKLTEVDSTTKKPKLSAEQQLVAYKKLQESSARAGGVVNPPGGGTTGEPNVITAMCKSVASTAQLLGRLHELHMINASTTNWGDQLVLRQIGSIKPKALGQDPDKWGQVSKAAKAAFEIGRKEVIAERNKGVGRATATPTAEEMAEEPTEEQPN